MSVVETEVSIQSSPRGSSMSASPTSTCCGAGGSSVVRASGTQSRLGAPVFGNRSLDSGTGGEKIHKTSPSPCGKCLICDMGKGLRESG